MDAPQIYAKLSLKLLLEYPAFLSRSLDFENGLMIYLEPIFAALLLKNCPLSKEKYAELITIDPCPLMIYQISSEHTRCLIDVKLPIPKNIKEYLLANVYPKLPEYTKQSFFEALETQIPRTMPCNVMPSQPIMQPGVMCMGDALNIRHPFTGGGMAVAFKDVVLFRDLFADLSTFKDHKAVNSREKIFYSKRRSQHSFVVNALSHVIYKIFTAEDKHLLKIKNSSFEYLNSGQHTMTEFIPLVTINDCRKLQLLVFLGKLLRFAINKELAGSPWWAVYRTIPACAAMLWYSVSILLSVLWSEYKF